MELRGGKNDGGISLRACGDLHQDNQFGCDEHGQTDALKGSDEPDLPGYADRMTLLSNLDQTKIAPVQEPLHKSADMGQQRDGNDQEE